MFLVSLPGGPKEIVEKVSPLIKVYSRYYSFSFFVFILCLFYIQSISRFRRKNISLCRFKTKRSMEFIFKMLILKKNLTYQQNFLIASVIETIGQTATLAEKNGVPENAIKQVIEVRYLTKFIYIINF